MKRSVMMVMLLSALMITATEGNWLDDTLHNVNKFVHDPTVQQIAGFLRKYGPLVKQQLGKRGMRTPGLSGQADGNLAQALVGKLDDFCTLLGLSRTQALNSGVLAAAFGESDGDKNGSLNDKEVDTFQNIVDVFRHCQKRLFPRSLPFSVPNGGNTPRRMPPYFLKGYDSLWPR